MTDLIQAIQNELQQEKRMLEYLTEKKAHSVILKDQQELIESMEKMLSDLEAKESL